MADEQTPTEGDAVEDTPVDGGEVQEFTAEDREKLQGALSKERELRAEFEKQAKAATRELEEAKQAGDSSKSELEKLAEKVAELESARDKAEREAMLLKVSTEKKVPESLRDRLRGDTVEELMEDADRIMEAVGVQKAASTGAPRERLQSGAAPNAPDKPDYKKLVEQIASGR